MYADQHISEYITTNNNNNNTVTKSLAPIHMPSTASKEFNRLPTSIVSGNSQDSIRYSATLEQIKQLQSDFYSNIDKNIFFKNNQKTKCANEISKQMNLPDLIHDTMYIIPDTNKVFFNYTVFKLYANQENYDAIVMNVLKLFKECIQKYNCFEIHVDLKSFTVSAATRYLTLIKTFCNECLKSNTEYGELATNLFIYNTPGMMEQISVMLKPFLHIDMRKKLICFNKQDSLEKLDHLHSSILKNSDIQTQSNSFA